MRQAFVELAIQNSIVSEAKISGSTFQVQIAVEKFSEATIGYRKDKEVANRWAKLFTTSYFLVSVVSFPTVSLCINEVDDKLCVQVLSI